MQRQDLTVKSVAEVFSTMRGTVDLRHEPLIPLAIITTAALGSAFVSPSNNISVIPKNEIYTLSDFIIQTKKKQNEGLH